MNFEPQKLFIGLVDFFSILMPGALLVYLARYWPVLKCFGLPIAFELTGPEHVAVFLFASYLVGHLAFLLSSLLDHLIYEHVRGLTRWGQMSKRLAEGRKPSARWLRWVARVLLFGKDADNAVMQVQRIKARALNGLAADDAVNAFQWSKARLIQDLPEGFLVVQRFEADSKFFRSFVVVLGALAVAYGLEHRWLAAFGCFSGMLPALWRYFDQRYKATQQAYWFVITLEAKKANPIAAIVRDDGLTHAGGVVYRLDENAKVEVMLIESQKTREERVLPKGHIEPGEDPRVTAVREIIEETGHSARVVRWLGNRPLNDKADAPSVCWFLLELCEAPVSWPRELRKHSWIPLEKAQSVATFPETEALLKDVAQLNLSKAS